MQDDFMKLGEESLTTEAVDRVFGAINSKVRLKQAMIKVRLYRVKSWFRYTNVIRCEVILGVKTMSETSMYFPKEEIKCIDTTLDSFLDTIRQIANNSSRAKVFTNATNPQVQRIAMYRSIDLEATPVEFSVEWMDDTYENTKMRNLTENLGANAVKIP